MAYLAQLVRVQSQLTVLDDRGIPAATLTLPQALTGPQDADGELAAAGWVRTAAWTATDTGWQAPVVASSQAPVVTSSEVKL